MIARQASCGRCDAGWVCEAHADRPMGHDGCDGAGMPCDCRYSMSNAGLLCPSCMRSLGIVETETARVMVLTCATCSHRWFVDVASVAREDA